MRQEFLERLRVLLNEKSMQCMRTGWVYGKLRQEFDLQADELQEMARRMGFKKGWNPMLKSLLEDEWEKENISQKNISEIRRSRLEATQRARQVQRIESSLENQINIQRKFSDTEMALFLLILEMNTYEKEQLLMDLSRRSKAKRIF